MTKGRSEAMVREAIEAMDLSPTWAYKPPDDAANRKPCDFFLWYPQLVREAEGSAACAWIEVKETANVGVWNPYAEVRPSQRQGIRTARKLGIPYLILIRWQRTGMWSLVDAIRLFEKADAMPIAGIVANPGTSIQRVLLESRYGVSASPEQLPSMLKAALIEGL